MKNTLQQHAQDALNVQNACNLSGVVHSLDTVVSDLWEYANKNDEGTHFVNTHPIVQAYVDKLASLSEIQDSYHNVLQAFGACESLAKEEKK